MRRRAAARPTPAGPAPMIRTSVVTGVLQTGTGDSIRNENHS
jgi:hypothetical protein